MKIILNESEIKDTLLEKFSNMASCFLVRNERGQIEAELLSYENNHERNVSLTLRYIADLLNVNPIPDDEKIIRKLFLQFNPASHAIFANIKMFRDMLPGPTLSEAKKIVEYMMELRNA